MKLRRLLIPAIMAALITWAAPPPGVAGVQDIIFENDKGPPKNDDKKSSAVAPSIAGSARPADPGARRAEQPQSWRIALRDMLRYLLGELFPSLNGRLR